MSNNIPNILQTLGLGTESSQNQQFNPECINQPVKLSRAKNLVANTSYEAPTPADIANYKELTALSTGDLCRLFCIDRRKMNLYISQRGYEKGERLPSAIWANMLEAAELIEPLRLKPKLADIREEVLRTSQTLPTKHELFLMVGLSGHSLEQISANTGISMDTLKLNVQRGTVVFDEESRFVPHGNDQLISKITSVDCSLSIAEWGTFREFVGATSLSFLTLPPQIRSCTMSSNTDTSFSTGKGKEPREETEDNAVSSISASFIDKQDEPEKAQYDFDENTPYFDEYHSVFQPPEPHELRQIATWTGLSLRELALLMDIKERDIKFLMSHYAVNHVSINKKTGKESKPKTKYIRFYQWRRLLEVFNLAPQEKITKVI